jgi:hypothetical protein
MKCAVHPDVDAVAYCRNCGKALCSVCARPVRDVIYCEDCLAATLGLQSPPPPTVVSPESPAFAPSTTAAYAPGVPMASGVPLLPVSRITNPSVAFVLGLFPGLGAVYNGEYNKALIHIVVFAAMIVGLSSDIGDSGEVTLSLLLAGFIFYMAFDAMRTAKARSVGQVTVDPLESWSKERPIGPIILIGLGALFLLNNFSWFAFYRARQLWPLVLIGVGVLMFRNRMGKDF